MKKFLGIILFCLLLNGCAVNENKGGGVSIGKVGSTFWKATAGHEELVEFYSKDEVDEICYNWDDAGLKNKEYRVKNRNAMKEVLKAKGEDPLICMKADNTS